MSTPMDNNSVDLLADIGVPVFKVASCDLDNLPLLKYISKTEKPIILSTGMGSISEVGEAIEVIKSNGNSDIILLHCVSAYPPKVEDVNLRAMETLGNAFKLTVGYSDHTIGINISLAAVALGAKVIEKHFTLDKNMEGPDHAVSADPDDLERLVSGIREIEESFGTGVKVPSKDEIEMRRSFRKSIVAIADIKKGATIMPEMLSVKRPGTGISPKYFDFVAGRKAERDLSKDDLITMDDF
jgi:sialic acid synthase SpsE